MDQGLESKREFKSIVTSIKRINDNSKPVIGNSYDSFKDDLNVKGNATKKTINDFTSKVKGRTQNTKDIFGDVLETVDGFLGTEKEGPNNTSIRSKTLRYAKQASKKSLESAQEVITSAIKKGYFAGQGTCNPDDDSLLSISISPKEFDFINVLKVNPTSTTGKVMYETQPDPGLGIQFNRELYNAFDSTPYQFKDNTGSELFTMTWSSSTQKYDLTIPSGIPISDFIDRYYSSIEQPNIESVMKNAMYLTLQGDGTETTLFEGGIDYLNRLLTKLFSLCGNAGNGASPFMNTAQQQLNEDEFDVQDYFNFDDVEGIDLDDEDARHRRVLKFTDCNNFEVPINPNHMEDFAYLLGRKTIDENVNNTLKKAAIDAYEQSGNSIYFEGIKTSLSLDYVKAIPRAMISTLLSPKMLFPVSLSYQMVYGETLDVKDMMKSMGISFFDIIKTMFWTFIKEFWKLVKRDILEFVKDTAIRIFLNSVKRIKNIVLILIKLLLKILELNIQSCEELFNALLGIIKSALNRSVNIPIPGLLLVLSEGLPGFSADRAYMGAIQRMEDSGINTGDIYGSPNTLPIHVKSIIDAYSSEMDTNSYVKIALKPSIIPAGPGGAVISPLITGAGKLM